MNIHDLITKSDLEAMKAELVEIIRQEIKAAQKPANTWLRNRQVMQMFGISASSLQNLRANGTLPYSKWSGMLFYKLQDIEDILQKNYSKAA